jgi:acyl-CoA reductase-like NAD-dependent aldehyde dehydrogenase
MPYPSRTALVGGVWREIGETRTVRSPFDGSAVGEIGWGGASEAAEAVGAAHDAMRSGMHAHERAEILERISSAITVHEEQFVRLLALEAGKPTSGGRVEVQRASLTMALSAVEARKLSGEVVPMDAGAPGVGKVGFTRRVPVGVAAAITPFNFPLNLACHKMGPAIAAGCAVVLKPADKAPLAACLLADLALEAGLPPGWLNVVCGDPEQIARVFCEDRRVGIITFTGSSEVGWRLRERAPRKRVTLELGNATPVVVDETTDAAAVAPLLATSGFGFAGQSCISTQRVYVHHDVADELEGALAEAAAALVTGDPLDGATDVGPLITPAAAQRVGAWVEAARSGGARVLAGGEVEGSLVEPTVVADAPPGSDLLRREVFGPVVAVQRYSDFGHALELCNGADFGLQAGVFTRRLDRALAAADALEFGTVLVNESPTFRADQMPYGGTKDSGNTREGPAYAVREMTEERLVLLQPAPGATSTPRGRETA